VTGAPEAPEAGTVNVTGIVLKNPGSMVVSTLPAAASDPVGDPQRSSHNSFIFDREIRR